jgi:hypothetical protein
VRRQFVADDPNDTGNCRSSWMVESTGLTSDCSIENDAAAADSTRKVSLGDEVLLGMKVLRAMGMPRADACPASRASGPSDKVEGSLRNSGGVPQH